MSFGIAVVGLDHWYTAFGVLDATHKNTDATLIGAWDKNAARRDEIKNKYGDIFVPSDASELWKRADVDLVCVCTATDEAVPLCKAALQAGKNVLSVKPPARSLPELDGVLEVVKASGKWYGSFEGIQRLHPKNAALREIIASGVIGSPLSYHQTAHGGLPSPWPGQSGASWWLDASKVPGGAWIDHAIYSVDLARFIFGGEITHVTGHTEKRTHKDLALEDYGVSLMRLRTGAGAHVSLLFEDTWSNETGGGFSDSMIIGTKGSIKASPEGWAVTSGGKTTQHAVPDAPYFQFAPLAKMLSSGTPPPFGAADARANLAACLQFYASAKR